MRILNNASILNPDEEIDKKNKGWIQRIRFIYNYRFYPYALDQYDGRQRLDTRLLIDPVHRF